MDNDNFVGAPSDPEQSKFSISERGEQTYVRLIKFAYWLAGNNANRNNVMMTFDEIVGELLLELAKGVKFYEDLPDEELDAVIRRMMDNRISELKYRYYKTHRKDELSLTMSWDEHDEWLRTVGDGVDIDDIVSSKHRVKATRAKLSDTAKRVFDALIFGNKRLNDLLKLSNMRAKAVYKNHKMRVRPYHVADALMLSETDVVDSYKEIRVAYQEVCRGS